MKSEYTIKVLSGELKLTTDGDGVSMQHMWEAGASQPVKMSMQDVTKLVIALGKAAGERK